MAIRDDKRLALWERFRAVLSGRDWIYLASLLIPLAIYNLALKAIRIHTLSGLPGGMADFGLIRSDLLFNLGYVLLWIGLFALVERGPLRWLVVVLFHTCSAVVAATTTSAHHYYEETGSTLSLNVIVYSLSKLGEVGDVIESVASPVTWVLLVVILGYVVLGPWLVTRIVCGRQDRSATFGGSSRLAALGACLVSFGLVSFSLPVDAGGASKSFSRDAVVNVIMSEVDHARIQKTATRADANARIPPVSTHLEPTARTQKKNVVLIHLESVRSRSTTPYNQYIDTTPFLAQLSRHSLMAERAYTVVPHTSKAITSVNCGIEPHLVREITEAEPNGVPARCLPQLLEEQGYNTVWFSSATEHFEDRRALVDNFGYDDFQPVESMDKTGFQKSNYFGYEDDIMLDPSRVWLENHPDKPFLATYLGVTGHHDYRPVDRYGLKDYAQDPALDHYENEVRYLDFFVRNIIQQYKDLGLYRNTVFVIYGDHGEGFGEHDLNQHDNTIYEEGLEIPLIVHDPGRFQNGKRVETLSNELDILPTVFDLLGYKVTGGTYPGRSLLAPPDRDRTLFFSCFDDYRCLASLRGTEKYIYFFGNQPEEFYDLSKDPLEKHNIANERSKEELKWRRLQLLAWYSKVNAMYEERKPRQK